MKTIRTVRRVVEAENDNFSVSPKYRVGDYMEVYCGQWEGHNFTVADVRFNYDWGGFEYLKGDCLSAWYREDAVVLVYRKKEVA